MQSWGIISYRRGTAWWWGKLTGQQFHFGDFTLDQSAFRLQKAGRTLRLEKRPMELLIFLVQRRGEMVSRDEIAQHLWGSKVFLDTEHSINTAVRKVRQVLHDDPEKPHYIETVVGKGYRFAAHVTSVEMGLANVTQVLPSADSVLSSSSSSQSTGKMPAFRSTRLLFGGMVLLALFLGGLFLVRANRSSATSASPIRSIAVLPLENLSGDPKQEYLADGMTEDLIGRLAGIQNLRVISRTSVMRFKSTKLLVPEIAKLLHVDAIVEGSLIRDGDRVRVHAQLIRAATDEHIWAETYDRELKDSLSLESEIAQAIAEKVQVTVTGEERARLVAARNVSPEVYERYLKGRFTANGSRADVQVAIAYYNQAINKDPTFAPAYVGLADAYDWLGSVFVGAPPNETRQQAIEAAQRALQLDPNQAKAYTILGDVHQKEWHWGEAETEYKQALVLNPNDADAHLRFADWLITQGRTEEALSWARRARELDPLGDAGTEIGWILFLGRRYDEAERELRADLDVQPNDAVALFHLGFVLIANHQPQKAIPLLEKAASVSQDSPGVIGLLIRAEAETGRHRDALRLLAELKRRRQAGYVPAGAFVNAYLGLGDKEQAFSWLEQAYKEHSNILQFLKLHPFFDPLRADPRFTDLVHRVGLN